MAILPPWLQLDDEHISLALHVQPGARRSAIVGPYGERLKVAVQARATDGRANAALIELIAAALGQPRSAVRIASGAAGRDKRVVVPRGTLGPEELLRCLQPNK